MIQDFFIVYPMDSERGVSFGKSGSYKKSLIAVHAGKEA
jgi:hypothetical protein